MNFRPIARIGVLRGLASALAFLQFLVATPALAREVTADTSRQLWANFIVGLPKSEKLYVEADAEVAKQVSGGGDSWGSLYGTGLVEYYPNDWLDLTGELVTGFTNQDRNDDSVEATIRLGLRLHFLQQIINSSYFKKIRPERMSGARLSVANLARLEYRNFWYSGELPDTSDARFRNRIETKLALNRPNLGADGVWYLIADIEWFVPLSDDEAPERFATKRRARLGLGYRHSYQWRFDILAMADNVRDTLEGVISADARMIDVRVHFYP
jgi:hypothetical protein